MRESHTPQSRIATVESSYLYPETYPEVNSRTTTFLRAESGPATTFRYRVIKRFLDVFLVLTFSPLILLAIAIVAAVVKLNSPGPIFYSHRRIRKNGAFFSMWKFRTMCVNSTEVLEEYLAKNPAAHAEWSQTHKLRKDPRVTSIGLGLRRWSLDEIPQFWNVLIGQMSLVGPRPIVAAEVEKYNDSFKCYCCVKPGLTGLWQVSGRSEVDYVERVALDCDYVHRWSLRRDLIILLKTFRSVINQDGAF
jgi:lipopolysaccharide/colanic/teichoic acid biosynthesis glycosyltransferase